MSSNIDLVIFGARGDLARRKLMPALYQLDKTGLLASTHASQPLLARRLTR